MSSASAEAALRFEGTPVADNAFREDFVSTSRAAQIGNLRLEFSSHSTFDAVKHHWLRLETSLQLTPFQSFTWCREFWQAGLAGAGAKLDIITGVTESGDAALIIPLATSRNCGVRVSRMLNDANAAHRAPIMTPAVIDALSAPHGREQLFAVIRALIGADVLVLEQQSAFLFGKQNPLLSASALNHGEEITDALFSASSWEEFDRAHRSSKSRNRDKKRLEGLASLGAVSFYRPQTLLERQAFLNEILDRKSELLRSRGVYIFEDERTREFLMRLAALDGTSSTTFPEIHGLRVGNTWAAAHFGVIHGKTGAGLVIALGLPEAHAYSPGHLLMLAVLKDYFESGVTRFSFGLGESDLKTRWADERMAVLSEAIPLSPLGTPYASAKRVFWWLKREIKRRPALYRVASRVRVLMHDAKACFAP